MTEIKTRLQAINVLHESFKHNPAYKKAWQDYIEISITEAMEDAGIETLKKVEKVRSKSAQKILSLFDPIWWECGADSTVETPASLEQEAEALYPYPDESGHDEWAFSVLKGLCDRERSAHITAARQYMGEIERLKEGVEILKDLCGLKAYKDSEGKDAYYEHEQPKLWKRANDFLEALKTT